MLTRRDPLETRLFGINRQEWGLVEYCIASHSTCCGMRFLCGSEGDSDASQEGKHATRGTLHEERRAAGQHAPQELGQPAATRRSKRGNLPKPPPVPPLCPARASGKGRADGAASLQAVPTPACRISRSEDCIKIPNPW